MWDDYIYLEIMNVYYIEYEMKKYYICGCGEFVDY